MKNNQISQFSVHGLVVGDSSSRKISKVMFAVEIFRNSIVVCSLDGLVMFLRQSLYHDTTNIPTNLAIQAPVILCLSSVSTGLGLPNVTLTLFGQPVTDSLLFSCWIMPVAGPSLRYKKRTVSYRTGMQEKHPLGSCEMAKDAIKHGTDQVVNCFTYFDSRDDFFRETAYTVHRNFHEIILAGDPCCLCFDVEHYSPSQFHVDGSQSDNKPAITIATICHEAKCNLRSIPPLSTKWWLSTVSMSAGAVHKHSFYINFLCGDNQ